jgi:hypothetical protein
MLFVVGVPGRAISGRPLARPGSVRRASREGTPQHSALASHHRLAGNGSRRCFRGETQIDPKVAPNTWLTSEGTKNTLVDLRGKLVAAEIRRRQSDRQLPAIDFDSRPIAILQIYVAIERRRSCGRCRRRASPIIAQASAVPLFASRPVRPVREPVAVGPPAAALCTAPEYERSVSARHQFESRCQDRVPADG